MGAFTCRFLWFIISLSCPSGIIDSRMVSPQSQAEIITGMCHKDNILLDVSFRNDVVTLALLVELRVHTADS